MWFRLSTRWQVRAIQHLATMEQRRQTLFKVRSYLYAFNICLGVGSSPQGVWTYFDIQKPASSATGAFSTLPSTQSITSSSLNVLWSSTYGQAITFGAN